MDKPRVSLSKFYQEIDLEDITGVDLSNHPLLLNQIAQATIDYVKERVDSGFGIGGKKLKSPYSDAYAKSLAFQAAGKSKNDVNMQLTGDMLGSLDVVESRGSVFKYGIAEEDEIPKAYNHQTGDTVPKREWFGVTRDEFIDNVLTNFDSEIEDIKREVPEDELFGGAILRSATRIINQSDVFDDLLEDFE